MNISRAKRKGLDKRVKGMVKFKEKLEFHTSLRVGGEAEYFVVPECYTDIKESIAFAKQLHLPWVVIGNGTNILFPDGGYRGIVIKIGPGLREKERRGNLLRLQAGESLSRVIGYLREQEFNDFDFLVGIPGTIGGALAMNAGIPEGTISDLVTQVKALTDEGELVILKKAGCGFGYRRSLFQKNRLIIVEGEFKLGGGRDWNIAELFERRRRQPRGLPSPGCVFKNPADYEISAGELIDIVGLKGYKIGGAAVSTQHANFIVNRGGASCVDILRLIDLIRTRVYKEFRVDLELELEIIFN